MVNNETGIQMLCEARVRTDTATAKTDRLVVPGRGSMRIELQSRGTQACDLITQGEIEPGKIPMSIVSSDSVKMERSVLGPVLEAASPAGPDVYCRRRPRIGT